MDLSTPVFLTNRSDYHSLVLFRYIRQQLIAAQAGAVKTFCSDAASKPEDEFHYLGLLWNCAFKAGIASMGAHSESTIFPSITATPTYPRSEPISPPSITAAPTSPHSEPTSLPSVTAAPHRVLPTPPRDFSAPTSPPSITPTSPHSDPSSPSVTAAPPRVLPTPSRDFSALRPSTKKPFGSLHRRFRRRLQVPAPVPISMDQTEKVVLSLPFVSYPASVLPQLPSPSPIPSLRPPQIPNYHSSLPTIIPVTPLLPNELPSKVYPSAKNASGSFLRQPSWFGLKPKVPHWIRKPSALRLSRA